MSPEQARGLPVDKRTDIWAFGCVLFEMLAGKRAFAGETVSDVLAGILTTEPDWSVLPTTTTAVIRRLLGRCLTKDPRQRLRDIADARFEIDEAQSDPVSGAALVRPRRERLAWIAALTCVSLTAVALAIVLAARHAPLNPPEIRLDINTPPTTEPAALALSPDGQQIAFVAMESGRPRLWLRSLRAVAARPLAGTEGAAFPFWAPHGRSLGFFADDGKLKRVDVDSGAVPGKDTRWQDMAQLKPQTTTKEEVAARRKKHLLWVIPAGTVKETKPKAAAPVQAPAAEKAPDKPAEKPADVAAVPEKK
jgi:hypothetical protein